MLLRLSVAAYLVSHSKIYNFFTRSIKILNSVKYSRRYQERMDRLKDTEFGIPAIIGMIIKFTYHKVCDYRRRINYSNSETGLCDSSERNAN